MIDALTRRLGLAAVLAALAATSLAACGGDDAEAGSAPAESATVSTQDVPGYGDALVTKDGELLYMSTGDEDGESSCTGACAQTWQPLTVEGELTAGPDADPDKLSTTEREDGTKQVVYNDHPLYTNPEDGLAAGTEEHGGTWYLVDPSGEPIEGTVEGGY